MITIVDYGSGNIGAIERLARLAHIDSEIATTPAQLVGATHVILPGVGAVDRVLSSLDQTGLRDSILSFVASNTGWLLGICVGMHALAHSSEEGKLPGLGLINGTVKRFVDSEIPVAAKSPHMGWNSIQGRDHPLLKGIDPSLGFYFLHNYYFSCSSPESVVSTSHHGADFDAIVQNGNTLGVQFHPEKSHRNGIQLLKNFAELTSC